MALTSGLSAKAELVVAEADTAIALHSGDVPVLGTPRLVALAEEACVAAVSPSLSDDETTVGMRVELSHLVPSAVGARVVAEATLERVEGRRLSFTVSVSDADCLLGAGKITRVVVDRNRFLDKAH